MGLHKVIADKEGERVDLFLSRCLPKLTRSQAQRLAKQGFVTIEGKTVRPSHSLVPGDRVIVQLPVIDSGAPEAENIDLDFIEILIRDKFLFGKEGETHYIVKDNEN